MSLSKEGSGSVEWIKSQKSNSGMSVESPEGTSTGASTETVETLKGGQYRCQIINEIELPISIYFDRSTIVEEFPTDFECIS